MIMKHISTLFIVFFAIQIAWTQHYDWFKQIGGTGDDRVAAMSMDSNGDLIVIGTFSNTVDFDPASGTVEKISNGWWDAFVAKYDTSGVLIWARTFGSVDFDYAQTLFIDPDDNIYVAGNYGNTMDIDPSAGQVLISPQPGGICSYLLKLDSNGEYLWSRNLKGYDVRITNIKKGPQGIVCGGTFHQTAEFNNEGTSFTMISEGSQDVFIMTLNEDGTFIDAKQIGNNYQNSLKGFDLDDSGNLYLSSEFQGSIDVDPNAGSTILTTTNTTDYGLFVAKYASNLDLIWAKSPDLTSYAQFRNLIVHTADDIVFIGSFKDSIRFVDFNHSAWHVSAGDDDQFIGRMNGNGEISWIRTFGNEEEDDGGKLHVHSDGSIYMYDNFSGTVDMDLGAGVNMATSLGYDDCYILHLDSLGETIWFLQDSTDYPNSHYIPALVTGSQNEAYFFYNFYNEMGVMDQGNEHSFTSSGDFDLLLIRLNPDSDMLSIKELESKVSLFPNPSNNLVYISGLDEKGSNYTLTNSSGRMVQSGVVKQEISLLNLDAGIYLLQIGNKIIKIVKD